MWSAFTETGSGCWRLDASRITTATTVSSWRCQARTLTSSSRAAETVTPSPDPETLLVLYLGSANALNEVCERVDAQPVEPRRLRLFPAMPVSFRKQGDRGTLRFPVPASPAMFFLAPFVTGADPVIDRRRICG